MNTNGFLGSSAQVFNSAMNTSEHMNTIRANLLKEYKEKQSFRVAKGKSTWIDYNTFDEGYNLREILNDEVVIEFDKPKGMDIDVFYCSISMIATIETLKNLERAGYEVEVWTHGGKSPHIHIHDLPIAEYTPEKRALFKKLFIRKYVPLEYLKYVDTSLTGCHLIALEWAMHWKGCYKIKELIYKTGVNLSP